MLQKLHWNKKLLEDITLTKCTSMCEVEDEDDIFAIDAVYGAKNHPCSKNISGLYMISPSIFYELVMMSYDMKGAYMCIHGYRTVKLFHFFVTLAA